MKRCRHEHTRSLYARLPRPARGFTRVAGQCLDCEAILIQRAVPQRRPRTPCIEPVDTDG
jgi:hypothetical protein